MDSRILTEDQKRRIMKTFSEEKKEEFVLSGLRAYYKVIAKPWSMLSLQRAACKPRKQRGGCKRPCQMMQQLGRLAA